MLHIKSGHVQPLWAGHPWVYAQAIAKVEGGPAPGDIVRVVDPRGKTLGQGFWSPKSAIAVRLLVQGDVEDLEEGWLAHRIEEAQHMRTHVLGLPSDSTDAYRLINAEGDRLPGLIVDRYADTCVVSFLSKGMKLREQEVFSALKALPGISRIMEIGSESIARIEGFEPHTGIVIGESEARIQFRERGFQYEIDSEVMQKTGYYCDQREHRAFVERVAKGRRVLDACCYVGAFSLGAARGGAREVVAMDQSAPALALGAIAARHHGLESNIQWMRGDIKRELKALAERKERFDLIVLDPPKLIPTIKSLEAGRKLYRALNAWALRLLNPQGILVTCSCSAALRQEDFLRTLSLASRDAHRRVSLLSLSGQAADHPTPPAFSEGRYLKCAMLHVI